MNNLGAMKQTDKSTILGMPATGGTLDSIKAFYGADPLPTVVDLFGLRDSTAASKRMLMKRLLNLADPYAENLAATLETVQNPAADRPNGCSATQGSSGMPHKQLRIFLMVLAKEDG
jgi:hypothetical protein